MSFRRKTLSFLSFEEETRSLRDGNWSVLSVEDFRGCTGKNREVLSVPLSFINRSQVSLNGGTVF